MPSFHPVTFTVLLDNHSDLPGLNCSHALSQFLEAGGRRLLIDTGSDGGFLENADRLGVPVRQADLLVLTHGHWDHGNGIPFLLASGVRPTLLVHPGAWIRRRIRQEGCPERQLGLSWIRARAEEAGLAILSSDEPRELFPGVWTTGPIPDSHGSVGSPGLERQREQGWEADLFEDEQALVLATSEGLVVITGCCHRGVLNTLAAARSLTGEKRIHALIGGLHLKDCSDSEVLALAKALRPFSISHLWVNHCTGEGAFVLLRSELGDAVEWAGGGFSRALPLLQGVG